MRRRRFLLQAGSIIGGVLIVGPQTLPHQVDKQLTFLPLKKKDSEWRKLVSTAEYNILFKEGTEPPNSSPLNYIKEPGTFICAACYLPLFKSGSKYDSGTGWPSFYKPVDGRLETKLDLKLVWPRTEYHCARCGAHQGHVFTDGPEPTGLRYCNNGLALKFIPEDKRLPALRV